MPRIWNSQVQSQGYLQNIPDDSLQQLGQTISAIAEKKRTDNMAVDLAEFQKDQISIMEHIQNSGSHDTASKTDRLNGEPVDGGIPQAYMRQFKEKSTKLMNMYPEAKDTISQYEVSQFGKITNLYSSMKVTADVDYFQNHINTISSEVAKGNIPRSEAYASGMMVLDTLYMPAEMRSNVQQSMVDGISLSEFDYTLKNKPMAAIESLDKNVYQDASAQAIEKMNNDVDRYVANRGMKEINSANDSYNVGFRHNQDPMALALARKRGNFELAKGIEEAQRRAAVRDEFASKDLPGGLAKTSAMLERAYKSNDPALLAEAQSMANFMGKRVDLIKKDPEMGLMNEGIDFQERDLSSSESLVSTSKEIQDKTLQQFGIKPSFLGRAAATIVDTVTNSPLPQRAAQLFGISEAMSAEQKRESVSELGAISPHVGVVMSLVPESSVISEEVRLERLNLGTAILSDQVKGFAPPDTEWNATLSNYWSEVEIGDNAIAEAVNDSAKRAYNYYAQKNGWTPDSYKKDEAVKILDKITGGKLELLNSQTINFQLPTGEFADPKMARKSLVSYVNSGKVNAVDANGNPITNKMILKHGKMIPTGQNGLYKLSTGDQYFVDENGDQVVIDMNEIYKTGSVSESFGFDAFGVPVAVE